MTQPFPSPNRKVYDAENEAQFRAIMEREMRVLSDAVRAAQAVDDIDCFPSVDEDNGDFILYPNRTLGALAVYYTYTTDGTEPADPLGRIEGGGPVGTLLALDEAALTTLTVDGQVIWLKCKAVAFADGLGAVGPIRQVIATYHAANNRPVVSWMPYQPTDLTKEGIRFYARDDGSTVNFGYAVVNVGASAPTWPGDFTMTGLVSDPVQVTVEVTKPAEGATEKLVYYQAVDAAGNFAYEKPLIIRVDGNDEPTGWWDAPAPLAGTTPVVVPNTDDNDTGSWRMRVKLTTTGDSTYTLPAFATHADEFSGNAFGTPQSLSSHVISEGQQLNVAGYFLRTTSTGNANQAASMRSRAVYLQIRPVVREPQLVIEEEEEIDDFQVIVNPAEDSITTRAVGVGNTWANVHDGAGTAVARTQTFMSARVNASTTVNQYSAFDRAIISFDTAAFAGIPPVAATLTLRSLGTPTDTLNGGGNSLSLVGATPASSVLHVAADYGTTGTTLYSPALLLSAVPGTGTDFDFDLNADGLEALADAIEAGEDFSVALVIECDRTNTEPTWGSAQKAEVLVATVNHGTQAARPRLTVDGVTVGAVTLRHSDPGAFTTKIQKRTRTTPDDWPASWSDHLTAPVATGVLSSDVQRVYTGGLTENQSWVQCRLVYSIGGTEFYGSPITSSAFDRGKLPDLSVFAVEVDNDWNVSVDVQGDKDTNSIKVYGAKGIAPDDPDRTDVQAEDAIDGRTFKAIDIATIHPDLPLQLAAGETAVFGVLGYQESGGGGAESADLYIVRKSRPADTPGGSDPVLLTAAVSAVEDGSGNFVVTVEWTTANVDDTFSVALQLTIPGPELTYNDAEDDPFTNDSFDFTIPLSDFPDEEPPSYFVARVVLLDAPAGNQLGYKYAFGGYTPP